MGLWLVPPFWSGVCSDMLRRIRAPLSCLLAAVPLLRGARMESAVVRSEAETVHGDSALLVLAAASLTDVLPRVAQLWADARRNPGGIQLRRHL